MPLSLCLKSSFFYFLLTTLNCLFLLIWDYNFSLFWRQNADSGVKSRHYSGSGLEFNAQHPPYAYNHWAISPAPSPNPPLSSPDSRVLDYTPRPVHLTFNIWCFHGSFIWEPVLVHLNLRICGFHICGSNHPKFKNIWVGTLKIKNEQNIWIVTF